jgi:hypothetical protein
MVGLSQSTAQQADPCRLVLTSATPITTVERWGPSWSPPVSKFASAEADMLRDELEAAKKRIRELEGNYNPMLSRKERRKRAALLRKGKQ